MALSRIRPPTDARVRAFQVLTVLPTAALPLATGGDDMPVVALMLLGLVALQRRRPVLAGLALGAASSLKFTAWPLALLALWAASDLPAHRAVGRYLLGVAVVVVPVVVPVALQEPVRLHRQRDPVPAGAGRSVLAGGQRPARPHPGVRPSRGSTALRGGGRPGDGRGPGPLPGAATPRATPPRWPALTGWVMLVAIMLAPATRVGYLLYPINLFVWAWMLRRADDPALTRGPQSAAGPGDGDRSVVVGEFVHLDGERGGAGRGGRRDHHPASQ